MKEIREATKRNVVEFYDRTVVTYHDGNYLREGPYSPLKFRQHYIERMIEERNLPRGARILDVGCGPGELVLELTRKGYDAWGVDISSGMVVEATRTLENGGFPGFRQIRVGDIEELDFPDQSCDVVVAAGVLEYQKQDGKALSEMRRVLKKGGYLILNVTNRTSYVTYSEELYLWMKRQPFVKRMLNLAKGGVLRQGAVSDFPWRRVHSPRKFDRELAARGFRKVKHNYFRFSPLPVPFDSLLRSVCGPGGRYMERLTESPIGFIGGGYLVLCSKEE